jgi:hypothetical protein
MNWSKALPVPLHARATGRALFTFILSLAIIAVYTLLNVFKQVKCPYNLLVKKFF